jgi:hypothetical protein
MAQRKNECQRQEAVYGIRADLRIEFQQVKFWIAGDGVKLKMAKAERKWPKQEIFGFARDAPELWNCQRPSRPHNAPVDVHRGSDVGVAHRFLLNSYRSSDRTKPGAIRVPESLSTEMPDAGGISRPL